MWKSHRLILSTRAVPGAHLARTDKNASELLASGFIGRTLLESLPGVCLRLCCLHFLAIDGLLALLLVTIAPQAYAQAPSAASKTSLVSQSSSKGRSPTAFPVYNINDYGAVGDNTTLNSKAIQRAIDRAAEDGGGTVFLPPGDYLTGTIRLRDNITLYLENGCTIWGSANLADYDPKHRHLIYAEDAKNVVIRGQGTINGNGPLFWDNGRLEQWLDGKIKLPRTREMLRFTRCDNVVLENIDVNYGAYWNIGLTNCDRVTILAITMRNGVYEEDGPNTDGINLWNCTKVQISDCDIITGDDCIVVQGTSRDVTITNCNLQTPETALMISGVRNLTFSNSTIHDSGCGIGFRVWSSIVVDGVVINNIAMSVSKKFKGGGTAIYMWSFPLYVETAIPKETPLPPPGILKNVVISNVTAAANGLVCVNGDENGYVEGLTLENIKLFMYGGKTCRLNRSPPYPFPIYGFHGASPYSLFFRHVTDLKLHNVQIDWNTPEKPEWGSALRCWKVNDLEIDGFTGRQSKASGAPAICLKDVHGAFIHDCCAIKGTNTFLKLDAGVYDVSLMNNDLSRAKRVYALAPDAKSGQIFERFNRLPETPTED